MSENPLLPHAELRRLHAALKQCIATDKASARKRGVASTVRNSRRAQPLSGREALLAGTTLQLLPGDLLIAEPGDNGASSLAPSPTTERAGEAAELPASAPRLLLSAAMAAALRDSGSSGIALAFAQAGLRDAGWETALTWAQQHQLPLVLTCADPRGSLAFTPDPRARSGALEWTAVTRLAAKLQLPVLSVDGEDAVAVYRVMQEAALRARNSGGPAILWAMLPSSRDLAGARSRTLHPLRRLEAYLRVRKISL